MHFSGNLISSYVNHDPDVMGAAVAKYRENSDLYRGGSTILDEEDSRDAILVKNSVTTTIVGSPHVDFSLLLIFPKVDKQTRLFEEAALRLKCRCHLVLLNFESPDIRGSSLRVSSWTTKFSVTEPVDLIVIDRRAALTISTSCPRTVANHLSAVAADLIRQELCEIPEARDAVVAGLVPIRSIDKRQSVYSSTFSAGYNKCIVEATTVEDAERELLSFLHGELPLLRRCRQGSIQSKVSFRGLETTDYSTLSTPLHTPTGKSDQSKATLQSTPNLNVESVGTDCLRPPHIRMGRADALCLDAADNQSHDAVISGSLSRVAEREKRSKHLIPVRSKRIQSRSIPGAPAFAFDQEVLNKLINGRNRNSVFRFNHLNSSSPLCKVVAILSSAKSRCSNVVSLELQKAIDLICESDSFVGQLFKPINPSRDPLTIDLMEGLMVNASAYKDKGRVYRSMSTVTRGNELPDSSYFNSGLPTDPDIKACLEGDDRWDYNILELERITQKRPMTYLSMKIFNRFNVCSVLRVSESVIVNWLDLIQTNYNAQNPYHNATHAADVLQSCAYLLRQHPLLSVFDNLEEVGSLLAAVVHDLNHPGRTNPFLVNSSNPLAILYNDIAVLENHHVALAFELTRKDTSVNIFQNLTRDEYRTIRGYMVDMVLATEMARHFDHLASFVNTLSKPILQKNRLTEHFSVGSISSAESGSIGMIPSLSTSQLTSSMTGTDDTMEHPLDRLSNAEVRAIVRRMIIKCSDVNNQTRRLDMCKEWANRIAEEYFCQTEEEKRLNLPIVMPNFDRQTCNIPKSQMSFIDFFLKDMFSAFHTLCPIPELRENLEANYSYWEKAQTSDSPDVKTITP